MHCKPFLKYPGNKFRLVSRIRELLPSDREVLIEPFAGSCAVFLNTDYRHAILNDANPDLINLYRVLQHHGQRFIDDARGLFSPRNNTAARYYRLRDRFNRCRDSYDRALLFLYLSRHGFNGLVRYGPNGFNVPFGAYVKPYFPAVEMQAFHERAQRAEFTCENYSVVFRRARTRHVLYLDPPYADLVNGKCFTAYNGVTFTWQDQLRLRDLACRAAARGVPVLISNHDTPATRRLYRDARIAACQVGRSISARGDRRQTAQELLALYLPAPQADARLTPLVPAVG